VVAHISGVDYTLHSILLCCSVSDSKGSCRAANTSTCAIGAHGKTALYNSSCFPNFLMPSSSSRIFPAKRPGMSCPGVQISLSLAVYDGATVDPVLYSYQGCNCVSGFLAHYSVDSVGKLLCTLYISMLTFQPAILLTYLCDWHCVFWHQGGAHCHIAYAACSLPIPVPLHCSRL